MLSGNSRQTRYENLPVKNEENGNYSLPLAHFGQRFVGYIPPQAGAERLRGAHLRPILLTTMAQPMLVAMAMEDALGALVEGTPAIVDDVCRT